jgi:hypothetical protein
MLGGGLTPNQELSETLERLHRFVEQYKISGLKLYTFDSTPARGGGSTTVTVIATDITSRKVSDRDLIDRFVRPELIRFPLELFKSGAALAFRNDITGLMTLPDAVAAGAHSFDRSQATVSKLCQARRESRRWICAAGVQRSRIKHHATLKMTAARVPLRRPRRLVNRSPLIAPPVTPVFDRVILSLGPTAQGRVSCGNGPIGDPRARSSGDGGPRVANAGAEV